MRTGGSAQNRQFVANYTQVSGGRMLPNFVAVAAYDAMRAMAVAVQKQGGKADPDAIVASLKGYKFDSPRGPLVIDADSRDPVHNVYIRRVEQAGGKLVNTEFETFPLFKDPGNGPR